MPPQKPMIQSVAMLSEDEMGKLTRCNISHFRSISAANVDEIGDDPATDANFSTLVSENEERTKYRDTISKSAFQRVCLCPCNLICCSLLTGDPVETAHQEARGLALVVSERPSGKEETEESDTQCDEVEARPENASGHQ